MAQLHEVDRSEDEGTVDPLKLGHLDFEVPVELQELIGGAVVEERRLMNVQAVLADVHHEGLDLLGVVTELLAEEVRLPGPEDVEELEDVPPVAGDVFVPFVLAGDLRRDVVQLMLVELRGVHPSVDSEGVQDYVSFPSIPCRRHFVHRYDAGDDALPAHPVGNLRAHLERDPTHDREAEGGTFELGSIIGKLLARQHVLRLLKEVRAVLTEVVPLASELLDRVLHAGPVVDLVVYEALDKLVLGFR